MGHPLIKELRDQAAFRTKTADNPFYARKQTVEWRASDEIERLQAEVRRLEEFRLNCIEEHGDPRTPEYGVGS